MESLENIPDNGTQYDRLTGRRILGIVLVAAFAVYMAFSFFKLTIYVYQVRTLESMLDNEISVGRYISDLPPGIMNRMMAKPGHIDYLIAKGEKLDKAKNTIYYFGKMHMSYYMVTDSNTSSPRILRVIKER